MGMFNPSANVVIFRVFPSGPKSSRIITRSRPILPAATGYGYSSVSVSQRPPPLVEIHIHRLVNVRLRRDKLQFEFRR